MDNFLGLSRCDAMKSNVLVHCRRGSHDPLRHPGAVGVQSTTVSGSYFPRRNSKMLKRVQHDRMWDDGKDDACKSSHRSKPSEMMPWKAIV